MPSKSPNPNRHRRRSTRGAAVSRRAATRTGSRRSRRGLQRSRSAARNRDDANEMPNAVVLPLPPHPVEVISAVRDELDRLSKRWKNLLPRLKHSKTSNGMRVSRVKRRRRKSAS